MFGDVKPDDTVELVFDLSPGKVRGPWNEAPDFQYVENPAQQGGMPPAPVNPDDERSGSAKSKGRSRA